VKKTFKELKELNKSFRMLKEPEEPIRKMKVAKIDNSFSFDFGGVVKVSVLLSYIANKGYPLSSTIDNTLRIHYYEPESNTSFKRRSDKYFEKLSKWKKWESINLDNIENYHKLQISKELDKNEKALKKLKEARDDADRLVAKKKEELANLKSAQNRSAGSSK